MTTVIQPGLVGVALAACATGADMNPQTGSAMPDGGAGQTAAAPTVEAIAEQSAPPPLIYSWDTGFSTFLSPPIEVRRLARDDCRAAGYEVATVETMALEGSTATATFICRGDFE